MEIKHGCEGFDVRNTFPYRNVSIFKMDFELKIRGASRVWISMKFDGTFLETSRFDELWEKVSCLHLDNRLTHEKEFEVSNLEFLDLLLKIDMWALLMFD
jgi:hypothetical protein